MHALNDLVQSRKVLYLGVSDTPAWLVVKMNCYARQHGLRQFSVYQGRWSAAERDFEREIIPMAIDEGMALAPWDAIGGGKFQSKKELERRKAAGEGTRNMMNEGQTEEQIRASEVLCKIGAEHGIESPTTIALAYVLSKTKNVFPIVGGRKVEHLHDNIRALEITLTPKQIEYFSEYKAPFLVNMLGSDPHHTGESFFGLTNYVHLKWVRESFAIPRAPITPKSD